jgi:TetR/AcrR family transcriptional regulator of autoinduction and epiphytic fitness
VPSTVRTAPKRNYRSPTRERRAHLTRERILAAARAEFLRSGYAATTVGAVASAAGVSVPTVEQVFGTKPRLLQAAISFALRGDADPSPMLQRDWARGAEAAGTLAGFLAIVGRVLTDAELRSAGLVVAAFEAAHANESMRALADQLRAQRAETAAWIVDGLMKHSSMRTDITRDQAIDMVWLLMDPHGFCALTRDRGWAAEQFERWFTESVSRLLLAATDTRPVKRQHATGNSKERTS